MTRHCLKALCAALVACAVGSVVHAEHVSGPRAEFGNIVDANSSVSFLTTFHGGMTAEIVVDGDGDTDLDLYVYDENGNLIASDTDYTDYCIASWVPNWTGEFTVVIQNRGSVYNKYDIATN
ncbi:MAG: hypothetical protein JNG89_18620 [Planctomycetaceae bacterium]|nr:hypothetical protein [Planctomycetaceae bacterium]